MVQKLTEKDTLSAAYEEASNQKHFENMVKAQQQAQLLVSDGSMQAEDFSDVLENDVYALPNTRP